MWLAANKLTLNMTKTEFFLIGSKQRLLNFTANPTANTNQFPIERVLTVKSLGVHMKILLGSVILMSFLKRLLRVLALINTLGIRSHIRLYFPNFLNAVWRGDPVLTVFLKSCKNYKIAQHSS